MAVCVLDKDGNAVRVAKAKAKEIVAKGGRYITKSEWQRIGAGKG